MGINIKERQVLFAQKIRQGKNEVKADKEIQRDVNWVKTLAERKRLLQSDIRHLEQQKIKLQININKLLERERSLQ